MMAEIVLIVQLARLADLKHVHAHENGGYTALADCERDRGVLLCTLKLARPGAMIWVWCQHNTARN
jgi:hypothetical protein